MPSSCNPPRIAFSIPHYLPSHSYGGPVFSLKEISRLADASNAKYEIVCNDFYYDSSRKIELDSRLKGVTYLPNSLYSWFVYGYRSTKSFSLVYLNSFFHPNSSLFLVLGIFCSYLVLFGRKSSLSTLIISPRGELLGPRIISRKKYLKLFYIKFIRLVLSLLFCDVAFIASTEDELRSIRFYFPSSTVHIVPNLIPLLSSSSAYNSSFEFASSSINNERLSMVYFSRISHEKGLLEILTELSGLDIPFELNIYGSTVSPSYLSRCKDIASNSRLKHKVLFHGSYNRSDLPDICSSADLFLYRPVAENFSHAFFEALMCGLIPVVPNTVPWRFGLPEIDKFVFYDIHTFGDLSSRLLSYYSMSLDQRSFLRRSVIDFDLPSKVTERAASKWREILFNPDLYSPS